MLDSLDSLIAFVLIMLVVSLVITIAVQMTSAAGQFPAELASYSLVAALLGYPN